MVWKFPKKTGIKPPYDPVIPLLGIYPEETKIEKDTCIPLFIAAQFTIARIWKQPRWSPGNLDSSLCFIQPSILHNVFCKKVKVSQVTIYNLDVLPPYSEPVCSMSSSNCYFLTWIQISQEAGQVVWYSHLLKNFAVCCDPKSWKEVQIYFFSKFRNKETTVSKHP